MGISPRRLRAAQLRPQSGRAPSGAAARGGSWTRTAPSCLPLERAKTMARRGTGTAGPRGWLHTLASHCWGRWAFALPADNSLGRRIGIMCSKHTPPFWPLCVAPGDPLPTHPKTLSTYIPPPASPPAAERSNSLVESSLVVIAPKCSFLLPSLQAMASVLLSPLSRASFTPRPMRLSVGSNAPPPHTHTPCAVTHAAKGHSALSVALPGSLGRPRGMPARAGERRAGAGGDRRRRVTLQRSL